MHKKIQFGWEGRKLDKERFGGGGGNKELHPSIQLKYHKQPKSKIW